MLDGSRFGTDVALAADAAQRLGTPVSVVLVHARGVRKGRRRRRLTRCLHTAEGFVYELGPTAFAVLLPGATPWAAFQWALEQRRAMRRPRITCGVASFDGAQGPLEVVQRAACGLAHATCANLPAWIERADSVEA